VCRKELLQLQKELESSGLPDSVDEIHKAKLTYAAVDAKLTEHEQNFHHAHSNLKPSKELEEQFQLAKEALKVSKNTFYFEIKVKNFYLKLVITVNHTSTKY
jgi:hypothetical protein